MKLRPLTSDDIRFETSEWGNGFKCYGSLRNLSCVNHVIWFKSGPFNPDIAKAQMALELNRKLKRLLNRIEPFLVAPSLPRDSSEFRVLLHHIVFGEDELMCAAIDQARKVLRA